MNKQAAKRWMRTNVAPFVDHRTNEVNATELAEAWAREHNADGMGGCLDDETHWVWEAAMEIATSHTIKGTQNP